MDENALDEKALNEKALDENWAHALDMLTWVNTYKDNWDEIEIDNTDNLSFFMQECFQETRKENMSINYAWQETGSDY